MVCGDVREAMVFNVVEVVVGGAVEALRLLRCELAGCD